MAKNSPWLSAGLVMVNGTGSVDSTKPVDIIDGFQLTGRQTGRIVS